MAACQPQTVIVEKEVTREVIKEVDVSDNVFWVVELAIIPGQLDAFKALMNEMVAATQADEPGALNYEWFISEDGTTCHIYERYADSGR